MFTAYTIYNKNSNKIYIGHTADLNKRLKRHNAGAVRSTKANRPYEIVYTETYKTKSEAFLRELDIKKRKSRKYIESLIK